MQMTFRWFGKDKDTVTLEQIKQIPGVKGIVPALHYLPAGEAWPLEDVMKMKQEIEDAGFKMDRTYQERLEAFFPMRDEKNCERTYEILSALGGKP